MSNEYTVPAASTRMEKILCSAADHRIIVSRFGVFIIAAVFIFTYKSWEISFVSYLAIKFTSIILIAFGISGRIWALIYISGNKSKNLVQDGPYSLVRHPLYFFSFFGVAGIALSSLNLLAMASIFIFFIVYYPLVMISEEKKMIYIHGERYLEYLKRVPRFFPSFRNYSNVDTVTVVPRKFCRDLINSFYFLGIFLVFEVIQLLHSYKILPNLLEML